MRKKNTYHPPILTQVEGMKPSRTPMIDSNLCLHQCDRRGISTIHIIARWLNLEGLLYRSSEPIVLWEGVRSPIIEEGIGVEPRSFRLVRSRWFQGRLRWSFVYSFWWHG